jgi:hypothetical protein
MIPPVPCGVLGGRREEGRHQFKKIRPKSLDRRGGGRSIGFSTQDGGVVMAEREKKRMARRQQQRTRPQAAAFQILKAANQYSTTQDQRRNLLLLSLSLLGRYDNSSRMTSLFPCSDILYEEKGAKGHVLQFYNSLLLVQSTPAPPPPVVATAADGSTTTTTTTVVVTGDESCPTWKRRVFVGDVVAIECPTADKKIVCPPQANPSKASSSSIKSPWHPLEKPWKVGLILALWADQPPPPPPNSTAAEPSSLEPTYHMSVQWLERFQHLPTSQFSNVTKAMNEKHRPEYWPCVLMEASHHIQAALPAFRIVPHVFIDLRPSLHNRVDIVSASYTSQVTIDTTTTITTKTTNGGEGTMTTKNTSTTRTQTIPTVIVQLCCYYRLLEKSLDKNPKIPFERTKGWDALNRLPTPHKKVNNPEVPPLLVKAWKSEEFPWHANDHPLKQTLAQSYQEDASPNCTTSEEAPKWKYRQELLQQLETLQKQQQQAEDEEEMEEEEEETETAAAPPVARRTGQQPKSILKTRNTNTNNKDKENNGITVAKRKKTKLSFSDSVIQRQGNDNEEEEQHGVASSKKTQQHSTATKKKKAATEKKKAAIQSTVSQRRRKAKPISKAKQTSKTKTGNGKKKGATTSKKKVSSSKSVAKPTKPTTKKNPAKTTASRKRQQISSSSSKTRKTANKKSRSTSIEEDDMSALTLVSSSSSSSGDVIPLEPHYPQDDLIYYSGVELPWDEARWDPSLRTTTSSSSEAATKRWQFHVGDVIAVAWQDPTSNKKKNKKKQPPPQNLYYPYKIQWTPALVMGIFCNIHELTEHSSSSSSSSSSRDSSKYQMLIRWFYRWEDLDAAVQQRLSQEDATAATTMPSSYTTVLETTDPDDLEDFPVTAALGKLFFVPIPSSTTARTPPNLLVRQPSMPPSIAISCPYQFSSLPEDSKVDYDTAHVSSFWTPVHDWNQYYSISKTQTTKKKTKTKEDGMKPWTRCLKTADLNHGLKVWLNKDIKKRWTSAATVSGSSSSMIFPVETATPNQGHLVLQWKPSTWKLPTMFSQDNGGQWLEETTLRQITTNKLPPRILVNFIRCNTVNGFSKSQIPTE